MESGKSGQEMTPAIQIRRKRAHTKLPVQNPFGNPFNEMVADSTDETDSQSAGDSPANSPPWINRKPSMANARRAPRKIVRYETVEVKDFGVQVSRMSPRDETDQTK